MLQFGGTPNRWVLTAFLLDLPPDWKVYTWGMNATPLRIGQVTARVGLNPKTLRFYEAMGLVPAPFRAENGYRLYPPETVDLLNFIKAAQGLGLTLAEIKEVITIRQTGRPPCIHSRNLLEAKAKELDRKLADLMALRRRIMQSLAVWGRISPRKATVCPHIEAQSGGSHSASGEKKPRGTQRSS